MWNYEIALSQTLLDGRFRYGVNLFYIDGKNLIMRLPNPNGTGMLNQNSGTIDNTGVELQAAYRVNKEWSVDGNYSFLHMENPVIAAPEHKLYAGANFTKGRWSVSTGLQYIAGLYTAVGDSPQQEDYVVVEEDVSGVIVEMPKKEYREEQREAKRDVKEAGQLVKHDSREAAKIARAQEKAAKRIAKKEAKAAKKTYKDLEKM